ncbi:MAG: hypothetical protein CME33_25395 [Gimesia sp.]|nr:hypothetical protein [Gimesia sp.]
MAGLSGRAEGGAWFWIKRGSCDLLLALLGQNCIRAYPIFLMGGFVFFVVGNSDGNVSFCSHCDVKQVDTRQAGGHMGPPLVSYY